MIRSISTALPRSRAGLRKAWLKAHRWTALTIGWLLVLSGLLGAALIVAKPVDRWLHQELFVRTSPASARAGANLEGIRQALDREFGTKASYTFRPPRLPVDTTWVFVRGASWEGIVYFDPGTGIETGRRGELEGAYNVLFELHSSLMLGDTGKAVLTCAAAAYLLLMVSGLYLWWPARWPPSLRIRLSGSTVRALFDLHSVGGAVLGLAIAVSIASGAYMAWPPLRTWVTGLTASEVVQPPKVKPVSPRHASAPALDTFVATAQAIFPEGMVGYVQVPAGTGKPLRVRLKLPDDPHPNGLTSVWMHPVSGEVLAAYRWNQLDPGHAAVSVMYPLHTGELGGIALEVVMAIVGMSLAALGVTGLWLWLKRR